MDKQKIVYEKLDELGIPYRVIHHPAVFTIEEMAALVMEEKDAIVKNLFLRDAKGKRHFLVTIEKDKKADLKKLREQLGSTPLSFASVERLDRYLGLEKGSVTPFGVLNDTEGAVEVVFDSDLIGKEKIGIHPNDNTATVILSFADLKRVIEQHGNHMIFVQI